MKQELNQVSNTISDNPFMKNDKRKSDDTNSLPSLPEKTCDAEGDDANEEDNAQAAKRDVLKRELCEVLKGIREVGKGEESKSDSNTTTDDEESENGKFVDSDEDDRPASRESDVTIEIENVEEFDDNISENVEEEMSAL